MIDEDLGVGSSYLHNSPNGYTTRPAFTVQGVPTRACVMNISITYLTAMKRAKNRCEWIVSRWPSNRQSGTSLLRQSAVRTDETQTMLCW
jgi:hypothetical protein